MDLFLFRIFYVHFISYICGLVNTKREIRELTTMLDCLWKKVMYLNVCFALYCIQHCTAPQCSNVSTRTSTVRTVGTTPGSGSIGASLDESLSATS